MTTHEPRAKLPSATLLPVQTSGSGARHRRAGKARIADGESPRFGDEFRDNPRTLLTVILGGGLAVAFGTSTALGDDPVWSRLLGLVAVLGGGVVMASYFLRFRPALLATDRWQRSRSRRAVRVVLTHAWWVFLIGALVVWGVLDARAH